jgi:subtilisin family serine protease
VKRTAISLACVAAALALVVPVPALAATSSPSDWFFVYQEQWGLTGAVASINAPAAWCASTGAGVTIADVDSGANMENVDLQGKLIAGAAFLNGDGSQSSATGDAAAVEDDNGHGSETAGIMGALTDNKNGIASVAPDAKVLVVKVLKQDPNTGNATGSDSDVAAGIRYAADYPGVKVINLSIGPEVPLVLQATGGSSIPGAIQYAYGKGVAVAVAAGNNSSPAGNEYQVGNTALVVGALGPAGEVAYYSNTSRLGASASKVQLYAPGGDDLNSTQPAGPDGVGPYIVSTYLRVGTGPDSENAYSLSNEGTSFAAPHVAGTLALLMAKGMDNQTAMQRLVSSATSRNGGGTSGTVKELDAAAALGVAPSTTCGGPAGTPIRPGGESGGTHGSGPTPAHTATPRGSAPTAAPHSTALAVAQATPTAAPTSTPSHTSVADTTPPVAIAISGRGGGGGSPPSSPSPLLLAGLAVLIVLGAPAATWAVRMRRARGGGP